MKPLRTVIPFKPDNPKSRLSSFFSEEERRTFVELSLENVLKALDDAGIKNVDFLLKSPLLENEKQKIQTYFSGQLFFQTDERDLSTAVNAYLKTSKEPILIVMADLSLLTKEDILEMTKDTETKETAKLIRIAPGKDGGTNMLYIEAPDIFEVNYYGNSCEKHKKEAESKNILCETYESYFAASDMDEPEDLKGILKYGHGKLYEFVSDAF